MRPLYIKLFVTSKDMNDAPAIKPNKTVAIIGADRQIISIPCMVQITNNKHAGHGFKLHSAGMFYKAPRTPFTEEK